MEKVYDMLLQWPYLTEFFWYVNACKK